MSIKLPSLELPSYKLTLPVSKKSIEFVPFTVKQEKNLLISLMSEDEDSIFTTFKEVINTCVLEDIKAEDLPITDLEFLFLNIRGKSVGEVIELKYRCTNEVESKETKAKTKCGNIVEFFINIEDIKVQDSEFETNIMLSDKVGIMLKVPSYADFVKNVDNSEDNQIDATYNNIIDSIEAIYDSETVYKAKDCPREDIEGFVDNMTDDMFRKIDDKFFSKLPSIRHELKFVCGSCACKQDIVLESVKDFFM